MKNGEHIQDYVSRVLTIVCHIRALGEELPEQSVIGKILQSRPHTQVQTCDLIHHRSQGSCYTHSG